MIPKLDVYKKRWSIESDQDIKPGLEQIQKALVKLAHPEKKLKVIHIAGTNGKGSTIAFMESILKTHGYTVGVFSSPAIIDIHDQIRIDGSPISEEELDQTFKAMKTTGISGMLTDFELLTVAAFVTFERLKPDYVLLETGLGGLLDSTNVLTPLVSVITSIALDHTALLGNSLTEIATHKAGIIKKGVPVVVGDLEDEALRIIQQTVQRLGSALSVFEQGEFLKTTNVAQMKRQMKGQHQGHNAAVAIASLHAAGIGLNEDKIELGVATAKLAYRFEEIYPNIFLDGAHNPAAAKALAQTIKTEFPSENVDFVIGMLKGKDLKGTLDELMGVAHSFTFLTFNHPLAATGEELMNSCTCKKKRIASELDKQTIFSTDENRRKVVTGSLYLLATLLKDRK